MSSTETTRKEDVKNEQTVDKKDKKPEPETKEEVKEDRLELSPSIGRMELDANGEHKLETPWTFYYDKKLHRALFKDFEKNLQKLGTFNTAEGFWRHYSHLQDPNDIPRDHNLFMFRNNWIPAWETFPNGGCWIIKVRKRNGLISRLWEELAFACIGELFQEPDIAGIVLSTRPREDNLSVWNRDNSKADVRFNIGEKLKEILNLDESTQVEYKYFRSAIRDGSSFRNAKPYVYAAQAYTGPADPTPAASAPARA